MTPPSAAAAAPAVRPARRPVPARTRPRTAPQPTRRPRRAAAPAAKRPVRAIELAEALTRHRLLDRLIRGRAWIGLLAFALIGIVAMQLWVLKLNAGIGRAVEHAGLLERQNTALSIENSEASSGDRVEQLAAAEGMVAALPGTQRFLSSRGGLDTRLAAAALAHPVHPPAAIAATTTTTEPATTAEPATSTATVTSSTAPAVPAETSSTTEARQPVETSRTPETPRTSGPARTENSRPAETPSSPTGSGGGAATAESTSAAAAPGGGAVGPRG